MWEPVTVGRSGATVSRRSGVYRKESTDPADDLVVEGSKLRWSRSAGLPVPAVVECVPGRLLTTELPGVGADGPWPARADRRVVESLAAFTRRLHDVATDDCPFDRRLHVTLPEAGRASPDLADLDEERRGWSRDRLLAELHATVPATEDVVVCHGDLCPANVVMDPHTLEVTGVVDVGRLGLADRWTDLALMTRFLAGHPRLGPRAAELFLAGYGIEPDPEKTAFYRLLDEFF